MLVKGKSFVRNNDAYPSARPFRLAGVEPKIILIGAPFSIQEWKSFMDFFFVLDRILGRFFSLFHAPISIHFSEVNALNP
jgi:hypothetical protein